MEKKETRIYTVSGLTREIKSLLEEKYPFLWITGEISNHSLPVSGHSYFSLKDQNAVISSVMFRNQRKGLGFELENGMKILGFGRISLYEPRGVYQLVFEHIEPEGAGAMQLAFEQLKRKLASEGLFDEKHKKDIPFLPFGISVITSGTGAAVRDIINIAERRFTGYPLEIVPVRVQGENADIEISRAIEKVNHKSESELIILARGGGSAEDLSAFNSEILARAIFDSEIPVITGIGHQTDFTIADFVADLRAPTPSACAEIAIPDRRSLLNTVSDLKERLEKIFRKKISLLKQDLLNLWSRLKSPRRIIYDFRFRLEDWESRMRGLVRNHVRYNRDRFSWLKKSLDPEIILREISENRKNFENLTRDLALDTEKIIEKNKTEHDKLVLRLENINPKAVLKRGYSISRTLSEKKVITRSDRVKKEDRIEIILFMGNLTVKVEKTNG